MHCSQLDALSVNDCAEKFSLLDRFLAIAVQIPSFALHFDWEEERLLISFNKSLFFTQLSNFLGLHIKGLAPAICKTHCFAILVQLYVSHRGSHILPAGVGPVGHPDAATYFAQPAHVVHIVPHEQATHAHKIFESAFLQLKRTVAAFTHSAVVKNS